MPRSQFATLLLVVWCGAALAQDVVVTAVRDPVKKSYRKMVDGAKLFEERHHLAPAAALRFKLLPRQAGTPMDNVELEIAADSLGIPLKVEADRTFVLEKNDTALKENARVMPNRKAGTMTWRADVRTPGLPPDVRRLGDLRLECEVGMKAGLISSYPRGFFGLDLFPDRPDYCHRPTPHYLFFAERPIFSVTLVDGARREVLPVDLLYGGAARDKNWKKDRHCDCTAVIDRTYFVPLGDASWPDDTKVVVEYMGNAPAQPARKTGEASFGPVEITSARVAESALTVGKSTRDDVRQTIGQGVLLDFASGYEVWVYRERPPEKSKVSGAELVLLFEPSGILTKTRVR